MSTIQITKAPVDLARGVVRWWSLKSSATLGKWRSQVRDLRWSNYARKTYWAWMPGVMIMVRIAVGLYHLTKLALMTVGVLVALLFLLEWTALALVVSLVLMAIQAFTRGRAGAAASS
ncbi:hypothetical protein [Nocardia sp. NPDC057440]|uniref:hypothetical protein n=1 Tax=Nocardia sp. NPDC057440 TaxID=3346134 RepID=UPI00366E0A1B